MPRVTSNDGTSIAYRTVGSGSTDVLFVHGWMTSGHVWDTLIEQLELPNHRLIIPDLRGAGDSDPADSYRLEDYAADVMAVASEAGAEIFDLVGHSMGGAITQLVAATYPTRINKLALISPVPASGMELPDEAHELFYHSGQDRQAQSAIFDQACISLADDDQERLLDEAEAIPAPCIQQSYTAWTEADFADQLAAIRAETLVIASDDPFLPPDFLEQAVVAPIDDAHLLHIPEAGHYIQVEQTAGTKEKLENFL